MSLAASPLRPGSAVRIKGLMQSAELNGRRGQLAQRDLANPDRWQVDLGGGLVKSIRQDNLDVEDRSDDYESPQVFPSSSAGAETAPSASSSLHSGCPVRISGLAKSPGLNGLRGVARRPVVAGENFTSERWEVELRLPNGLREIKAIRAEHIVVEAAPPTSERRNSVAEATTRGVSSGDDAAAQRTRSGSPAPETEDEEGEEDEEKEDEEELPATPAERQQEGGEKEEGIAPAPARAAASIPAVRGGPLDTCSQVERSDLGLTQMDEDEPATIFQGGSMEFGASDTEDDSEVALDVQEDETPGDIPVESSTLGFAGVSVETPRISAELLFQAPAALQPPPPLKPIQVASVTAAKKGKGEDLGQSGGPWVRVVQEIKKGTVVRLVGMPTPELNGQVGTCLFPSARGNDGWMVRLHHDNEWRNVRREQIELQVVQDVGAQEKNADVTPEDEPVAKRLRC